MQRPIPWLWITVIGVLLLAPGFTARLFVDVLEGVTLLLVFGPLVLAGAGFWRGSGSSAAWSLVPLAERPASVLRSVPPAAELWRLRPPPVAAPLINQLAML